MRDAWTDAATESADSDNTVASVIAVPMNKYRGSIPPKNCINATMGSPASTNVSSAPSRAASFPNRISRPVRVVTSRKSSVFRSFSSVITAAVYAGVRTQTTRNCVTE